MSPAQLKLTYFDFGGRAELARLLFTFGGVAFEDNRMTGEQFRAMKPCLPLGQVPVLEVDGVVFSQSMAIARYAARVSDLYPQDPIQVLHVDMVSETLVDLVDGVTELFFRNLDDDAAKAEKSAKFAAEQLPKVLTALEKMVKGAFFAGDDSASLADVQLFEAVEYGLKPFFPDFDLKVYPKLENVVKGVRANTNIAAYLAK